MVFQKGDYTNCRHDISEILVDDDLLCTVASEDVETVMEIVRENLQLKGILLDVTLGDYTNCRCNICEIVDEDDELICTTVTEDVEVVIEILEENELLRA